MIQLLKDELPATLLAEQVIPNLPAIVKELVENSIDAQATSIDVLLKDQGLQAIQVSDDGQGISEQDLLLLGSRNATSKFINLDKIHTLGFRGEAIYSIMKQSSALTILTSQDPPKAFQLDLPVSCIKTMARSKGTTVTVIQPFWQHPVRRKDLEAKLKAYVHKCLALIKEYAISYHSLRLTLRITTTAGINKGLGLHERLGQILQLKSSILKDFTMENCTGVLGLGGAGKSGQLPVFCYLNQRPIQLPGITKLVRSFKLSLEICLIVLFISLNDDHYDIHVCRDKRNVLIKEPFVNSASIPLQPPSSALEKHFKPLTLDETEKQLKPTTIDNVEKPPSEFKAKFKSLINTSIAVPCPKPPSSSPLLLPEREEEQVLKNAKFDSNDLMLASEALTRILKKSDFSKMEIVGQFNRGFIIVKHEVDLFIIDQHAADEKWWYERLLVKSTIKQPLIKPVELNLSPLLLQLLMDNLEEFKLAGYTFSLLETGCQILTRPGGGEGVDITEEVEEILQRLQEGLLFKEVQLVNWQKACASKACKAAIKIGQVLSPAQMKKIVTNLGDLDQPWNCPHGRPTVRHLQRLL